ncbi:class I SAM-dependent methyltransferase [Agriterribacter sp.]|uniref:class I SAM-dependent methyltransferase n=1 Tax=Agriterribacter sp. TaxID=2821509 RepID=UPI002C3CF187|nr:class I SAM-dependent methyltransferase [Agriterribacter sp.]HRO45930.1 class I SAM-dependent methyltransferase [Agriterribacter sp.]HRQ18388.1 class I SAM-dependent methyltransferase [Agriterribacter sp.]
MKILQTAERVSQKDHSDNYVFQRSLLAYIEAAKLISGKVLEIGTGSGYGVNIIAPHTDEFVTIDKYQADVSDEAPAGKSNVTFIQMNVPPLHGIPSGSFDFVITFQVIEHIQKDNIFLQEISRVLKSGGKLIVTTPNKKMSLTRNPWHVREYTVQELEQLLLTSFQKVQPLGVFGNEAIMDYYARNKAAVERITRFDVLNLQYRLPRRLLQIPYDILNRLNRKKLLNSNKELVTGITYEDYTIRAADDDCFDLFFIAEKA